jgi:hypothetical protein
MGRMFKLYHYPPPPMLAFAFGMGENTAFLGPLDSSCLMSHAMVRVKRW